ncbi:hypothetical protein WYH_01030 [Croceibacterium atlanticum]|uniref:BioF2-like acetyltransferase domain-containing protein n=1 Tax=Croceibacterium atlanticum TaxID=1267766 RepID=A0A0F7KNI4_9SPHN|nr:hypothetical protein WYH_01030 [Croceibacterium atlanticum]
MASHAPHQLPPEAPAAARPVRAPALRLYRADWRQLENPAELVRWDALSRYAVEPNPFFESWYLLPSLRALDPGGSVAMLLLEAEGQLAGLLPVQRARDYYGHPIPHWRNWIHANAFLGTPLVAPGFERQFWQCLFHWADENAGTALFFHMAQMAEKGPLHRALVQYVDEAARPAATVLREERAALISDLSPEEYLERSLSGKKRKELRRQHRRLSEEGDLTVERKTGGDALAQWTAEFLDLERSGWKGEAQSALDCTDQTRALFRNALQGAAEHGRLERIAIRLDGKPLAMLVNFLCPPGAFSYKTAFDESFARYSPGVLLQRENLALLTRSDIAWTDSCAAADHPMIDHFWREKRNVASHNIGIGGSLRRMAFRVLARIETNTLPKGIA